MIFDADILAFLAIFGYVGYFWLYLATFGYFRLLLATFGYFWLLLATFGYFWLLLATFGHFWLLFLKKELFKNNLATLVPNYQEFYSLGPRQSQTNIS